MVFPCSLRNFYLDLAKGATAGEYGSILLGLNRWCVV